MVTAQPHDEKRLAVVGMVALDILGRAAFNARLRIEDASPVMSQRVCRRPPVATLPVVSADLLQVRFAVRLYASADSISVLRVMLSRIRPPLAFLARPTLA